MSDPNHQNLPEPAPAKPTGRAGGPDYHRPGCKCNACVARRRKAEAIADRTGPATAIAEIQPTPLGDSLNDTDIAVAAGPLSKANNYYSKDAVLVGTDLQRHRVKMWLQWKAIEPKLTHADAAARLDIAPQTLTNLIHRATKAGWLSFDDPMAELEYEILPEVNRVIKKALKENNEDVAVKTAQATIFKTYAQSKGVSETPTTVLALKIEMPQGVTPTDVPIKGVIVGSPRTIDAEVITEE